LTELFLSAFVTLFVVIDPLGCGPIFAGLTSGASDAHGRAMALRSTLVASIVLILFALVGRPFLNVLGIGLDAFRIAGGIMLFLIALEMVFEKRNQRRTERAEGVVRDAAEAHRPLEQEDVSVFPMAIPMIAGPGSIATVMLMMARAQGLEQNLVVLGALVAVMALMLISLLGAIVLMRMLGARLEATISRLLGVILAALATQFVIDGLKASFA
jgi:multiple antibiotic resistance protein